MSISIALGTTSGLIKSTAVPLLRYLTMKAKSDSAYFIRPSLRVGLRDFCDKISSREAALALQYKLELLKLTIPNHSGL